MKLIKDLINLENRVALVTGATGYIGKHIASVIAELGGSLILVDKPNSDYNSVIEIISELSEKKVICLDCDLESKESRRNFLKEIKKKYKNLHILINNAAFVGTSNLLGWNDILERQSLETWERAINVNISSIFHFCRDLSPLLKSSGKGVIINVSSIYGFMGPDYSLYEGTEMGNPAAYSVSKGGLIQLTKWFSTTLAPEVRVNAISPGGVFRNQPKSFVDKYLASTPLNRMCTEDDLKGAIAYLSSDLSEYVTGQNLVIDGGKTIK